MVEDSTAPEIVRTMSRIGMSDLRDSPEYVEIGGSNEELSSNELTFIRSSCQVGALADNIRLVPGIPQPGRLAKAVLEAYSRATSELDGWETDREIRIDGPEPGLLVSCLDGKIAVDQNGLSGEMHITDVVLSTGLPELIAPVELIVASVVGNEDWHRRVLEQVTFASVPIGQILDA